jgi:uncharacterized Tic20 family protein
MLWAFVSHQIHFAGKKSHAVKWSVINVVGIVAAILIVTFPFEHKPFVLMILAVVRSLADYGFCWKFYFPPQSPAPATRDALSASANSSA